MCLGQLPGLRRYARSLTRSNIDAEDLAHDAVVRAYEQRASFRAGHNMKVWLLSILYMVELVKKHKVDGSQVASIEAEVFQLCYDFAGGGLYGIDKIIRTKEQADHSLPCFARHGCLMVT